MNFYMVDSADSYAGYLSSNDEHQDLLTSFSAPLGETQWPTITLEEYLGDPPRKPAKKGDFHTSALMPLFSERAVGLLSDVLHESGILLPVSLKDREELFYRFWITHEVDCLDIEKSKISPSLREDKIGVVKVPVIDISLWDGSPIFCVANDYLKKIYASSDFVDLCKKYKIKGISFRREYFDDKPINI